VLEGTDWFLAVGGGVLGQWRLREDLFFFSSRSQGSVYLGCRCAGSFGDVTSHFGVIFVNSSLKFVFYWTHSTSEWIRIAVGAKPLAKFEDCLQRLEKIVQELEKGEVPLEKSLTLFEEGMQLSGTCRKELEQAEGKVEILLKQNGKLQAESFAPLTETATGKK
jgi:exodeoxyribonuclease VII small subunit